ncbi:cytochrome c oxidase assembly protein [Priestia abyssalis]|uniref:cytochrome c oxidase assembly protein n=1 Tax=Priestia abyssalis TaxID=1221450 RepID=UPI00111777E4|nr:cytochrome c oxidase assembly protein [Priestia abyssalis]
MFTILRLEGHLVWNTPLLAVILCTAALYAWTVKYFTNKKILGKQPLFFFLGLGILYITIGSPLSAISHLSFSLHMIQMSILFFIIPPILLLGIPALLIQQIREIPVMKGISKLFFPPMMTLIVFAILFFVYHLPIVLKVLSQNPFIHHGYIILLFILSYRMWWPIAALDPKRQLLKGQKKRYAFLSGIILMPACFLFILNALTGGMNNPFLTEISANLCMPSQSSLFAFLPSPFNTRFDQLMAGILMVGIHKLGLILTSRLGNKMKEGG